MGGRRGDDARVYARDDDDAAIGVDDLTVGNSRAARYSARYRESARALLLIAARPTSDFSSSSRVATSLRSPHPTAGHVVGGHRGCDDRIARRTTATIEVDPHVRLILLRRRSSQPSRDRARVPTRSPRGGWDERGSRGRLLHHAAEHPRVRERRVSQVPRLRHPPLGGAGEGPVRGERPGGGDDPLAGRHREDVDGAPGQVRGGSPRRVRPGRRNRDPRVGAGGARGREHARRGHEARADTAQGFGVVALRPGR